MIEPPPVPKARDPRFDPTVLSNHGSGGAGTRSNASNKAYAFLDEYRASELQELKNKLGKTKDGETKEELKRAVRSQADRMRSIENKKREGEIMLAHKRKEKELLREGKKSQPYYLKKSELKEQVLRRKYEEMGSKDRAKALERRRKKVASKERRDMPMERRGATVDGGSGGSGDGGGQDGGSKKKRRMG